MRLNATISTANVRVGWIWWNHGASQNTGGAGVETCWVVGAADEVEEVWLPEMVMVVEVAEDARVEEFEGIEVTVRVGAVVGVGTVWGAGDVEADEATGGVGAVGDGEASSGTEEVVSGEAARRAWAVGSTFNLRRPSWRLWGSS